jgi:NADH-quinone oxidoreductase subunit J
MIAAQILVAQNIFFGVIALAMLIAAARVVTCQNVIHAALNLMVVLAGAAGIFILLGSEFIAVTQILVYLGAISVLFVFGVMLTRAPIGKSADLDNSMRGIAGVVALLVAGVFGWVIYKAYGTDAQFVLAPTGDPNEVALTPQLTREVGIDIFANFLIPLQMIAVLLLAALVGAVTIARKD